MKFSIDKDIFANILKRIDGVCSNRGSFAILSSCLIEARDNSIVVTGTDLEITLRVVESAKVIEEGIVIIDSHRLLETVQNQMSGIDIMFTSESSTVIIEAGNFRARIPSGDIAEYPQIPNIESRSALVMSAQIFKLLIDRTFFSISKDDSRQDFTGAFLTISQNGTIQMVSTDSHRLSRAESTINITGALPAMFETGVIVPRKGLSELSKALDTGDVSLDISSNKLIVLYGNTSFYINLIAGNFPDFSKVIPVQLDHKAVIKRDSFLQMLKRASIFTAKTGTIRLTMNTGRLDISNVDSKSGEMHDYVEADYDGSGVTAGFNWRYISDILNVIDSDSVSLEIIDMDSPAVIRDVNSDKFDFIVMPMQL
ncbi:MAG: DNA polymerase III subunit beta [Proteobacteria bacterium]|nr:DNA polymerase III subunit beta [Pseudomonadota bacterium]